MADFSTPGEANPFIIETSKSNFIKTTVFYSICPVIFTDKNGRVRLVIGASGGPLYLVSDKVTSIVSFFSALSASLNKPIEAVQGQELQLM